jgi:hypothetical protein
LDERNATGGRFLLTISMICKNIFQGNAGKVNPAGISRKLKAENIFYVRG